MVVVEVHRPHGNRRGRGSLSIKKCLYAVICFSCGIFLLPILLQDAGLSSSSNIQQWQQLETATLSQLRHTARLQQDNSEQGKTPDGYFNGFPVYLREDHSNDFQFDTTEQQQDTTPHSRVHCVGEDYQEDAWLQRSCEFSMLCFDLQHQDFVIFRSHREEVLSRFLQARPAMETSSTMYKTINETMGVALGGINKKWNLATTTFPSSKGFKWFPRILNATPGTMTYYALPSNTIMVPYHSLSAKNPGHLVWDDFLPIYTLLTMFQLQNRQLLPLRVRFSDVKLWASCEASDDNERLCQKMTDKFSSLLVGRNYPYKWTTTDEAQFVLPNQQQQQQQSKRQSNYVCAPRGAAGLGPLTDHGTKKLHGWIRDDYKIVHNHGRGAMLYEFRNFMLENLGLPLTPIIPNKTPFKVVISLSSSDIKSRDLDFAKQISTLQENFSPDILTVESYVMKDLSVEQQVKVASEAAFFITICGGGAVTGMFLPKGATVILYYLEHGGVEYGTPTHLPAFLDWDLFNNLSHLRTHWLPTQTMDQRVDLRALVLLVQQELELMQNDILL